MAGSQSTKHQKRSRGSDAAEKVSRSGDERAKRRRTSEGNDAQKSHLAESSAGDSPSQDVERRKGSAPWSFSRPVGGRYSNLDPILTADEAWVVSLILAWKIRRVVHPNISTTGIFSWDSTLLSKSSLLRHLAFCAPCRWKLAKK